MSQYDQQFQVSGVRRNKEGESKKKNETTVALLAGLTWLCSLLHTLCGPILTTLSQKGLRISCVVFTHERNRSRDTGIALYNAVPLWHLISHIHTH